MRTILTAATAAVTSVLVVSQLAGCGSTDASASTAAPEETAVPVEVITPMRGEMLATYSGTATLEAEADAEVIAKVEGEVTKILVEEGDRVAEGDLLARLDDRRLWLEAAQVGAELAKVESEYRRQIELHEKGLIAAGTLEKLRFDLDHLLARHDLAQLQLSYTQIRAPFAGTVSARNIRLGQTVQPGAALFRITDPAPLRAQVFVPERELPRLKPGQLATVAVDAVPGRVFPARVSLVSPTVDAESATFKVTVEVRDTDMLLKPGMFARIGIVFDRKPDALKIPRVALIETDGEQSVFVVQDGIAHQRAVDVGLSEAGHVEITRGLSGNEAVVVVGQSSLKEGSKVRVVTLQAAST